MENTPKEDKSPQPMFQNSLQKFPSPAAPRMPPSQSQEHQRRSVSPTHRHSSPTRRQVNGTNSPPLLMAPPRTILEEVNFRWNQVSHALGQPTPPFFRFLLFVFKMIALARACWPNSFNLAVGGALVIAAAIDLSWMFDMKMTILLFLFHFIPIWYFRGQGELCHTDHDGWEWNPAAFDISRGPQP